MSLNGKHVSPSAMNTVSSTPPKKKMMYRSNQSLEDLSRAIGSNGTFRRPLMSRTRYKYPIPDTKKRSDSSKEDDDFEKHFGKGRFLDDSDCTWLSSDCLSSSSFFDQYNFLGSRQFVDEWLASWMSNWGKSVKSAILDLDMSLEGDTKDEDAENWLLTPFDNDASVSSCTPSEDTSSDNSSTQFSRNFDAQTRDHDGPSLMLPLGNLDVESDQLENFQLDGICGTSLPRSSSSSSHALELMAEQLDFSPENVSATADLKSDESEPIFWPFDGKFDSNAEETMRYLSMSPRKDMKVGATPKTPMSRKLDQEEGTRKQLQFNSAGSKSCKRSESSPNAGKSTPCKAKTTTPSRLSRNLKNCTKVLPTAPKESIVPPKKSTGSEKDLLGEEDLSPKFEYELPIEKLLGLSEFNGHEGVDAGFDGDVFLLD
ncbi:hypothetical protein CDL15_Pgr000341 [Punica granatum]|nr:hypothetical protein CDL15_Pgr000341 [Punica granatum]